MEESSIEAGDAVLLNYGWARNWGNPSLYNDGRVGIGANDGSPGIGVDVARWLAELITRNGILLLENLDLRALAEDAAYEFLFIFSPTKFKGATGSPGGPLAIR
jgi:kynurenine formamidase